MLPSLWNASDARAALAAAQPLAAKWVVTELPSSMLRTSPGCVTRAAQATSAVVQKGSMLMGFWTSCCFFPPKSSFTGTSDNTTYSSQLLPGRLWHLRSWFINFLHSSCVRRSCSLSNIIVWCLTGLFFWCLFFISCTKISLLVSIILFLLRLIFIWFQLFKEHIWNTVTSSTYFSLKVLWEWDETLWNADLPEATQSANSYWRKSTVQMAES